MCRGKLYHFCCDANHVPIRIFLLLAICICLSAICHNLGSEVCPLPKFQNHGQTHRMWKGSWTPRCASKHLMYTTNRYTTRPDADDVSVEPAFHSARPCHVHQSQKAWFPPLHFKVLLPSPGGEMDCCCASESKFRSFVEFLMLKGGLEPGSLHESQLANQATVPLRPLFPLA